MYFSSKHRGYMKWIQTFCHWVEFELNSFVFSLRDRGLWLWMIGEKDQNSQWFSWKLLHRIIFPLLNIFVKHVTVIFLLTKSAFTVQWIFIWLHRVEWQKLQIISSETNLSIEVFYWSLQSNHKNITVLWKDI